MRALPRSRAAAGALVCWALVVIHVVAAFDIVFGQRIGPVVAVIDAAGGHGVHQGDMLALPLLLSAVVCFLGGVGCTAAGLNQPQPLPWRQNLR